MSLISIYRFIEGTWLQLLKSAAGHYANLRAFSVYLYNPATQWVVFRDRGIKHGWTKCSLTRKTPTILCCGDSKQQASLAEPRYGQAWAQELIINGKITVMEGQPITEVAKLNYRNYKRWID